MKKYTVFQLVAKEDVHNPAARVFCTVGGGDGNKLALDILQYELTRAKGNTCVDCMIKNPVIRKITLEEIPE